jgi:putative flippase GtrA
MTITWLLNRNITFASDTLRHNKWVEGASYMLIMLVGAGINFLIYALLMLSNEVVRSYPILGVAVGTGIALIWNFNVARTALYRRRY